jgi:hypothetical protein
MNYKDIRGRLYDPPTGRRARFAEKMEYDFTADFRDEKNIRPFAEPPGSAFLPMSTTVFRLADRFFNPPAFA